MPTTNPTPASSVSERQEGPYTISVLKICDHCDGGGEVWGEDPETGEPDEPGLKSTCGRCAGEGARLLSRKAFVTLDEARRHVVAEVRRLRLQYPADDAEWNGADMLHRLIASFLASAGGTVGPLPDGSVIEVEKTTYGALYAALSDEARAAVPFDDEEALLAASQENGGAR